MSVTDKIKSIGEGVGATYTRPDPALLGEYTKALTHANHALEYLHSRGLDDETIAHFQLGYDADKNAISIPVLKGGEVISYKYRIINPRKGQPKYLCSPSPEPWVFNEDGFERGRNKRRLLIVEGEFDAMMCWQNGFKAVVSPAHGKDSFGIWLEMTIPIDRIYIAYDNDDGGKESAGKMAKRIGEGKVLIVQYPDGVKDASEYFAKYSDKDFIKLIAEAVPFFKNNFKSLGDIITRLRTETRQLITSPFLPDIKMQNGWLVVVSGRSNVGKTSYVLNIVKDFVGRKIPTLVLPFERGVDSVGERFLNVFAEKTYEDFGVMQDEQWRQLIDSTLGLPLYFATPKKEETLNLVSQAARMLDVKVVVVDHLDYMVRNVRGSREEAISNTLQEMKRVAEEMGLVFIVVTHIRKIDGAGDGNEVRRPGIEDMKGSSSLYQDPEAVVMLSQTDINDEILVDVVKNKGKMSERKFNMRADNGVFTEQEIVAYDPLFDPNSKEWK